MQPNLLFLTHFPIGGRYLHEEQKCAKYFTLLDTFLNGKHKWISSCWSFTKIFENVHFLRKRIFCMVLTGLRILMEILVSSIMDSPKGQKPCVYHV